MNRDSLTCPNGHKVAALQWWAYSSFKCYACTEGPEYPMTYPMADMILVPGK